MREPLDLHRSERQRQVVELVVALGVEQERRVSEIGRDRGACRLALDKDRERGGQVRLQFNRQQRLCGVQLFSHRSRGLLYQARVQAIEREGLLEQAERSDQDQVVACGRQTSCASCRFKDLGPRRFGRLIKPYKS